ncbi:LVIVD repeat-containing protein [Solirubrobacter deserti]|uniref:Uncharacterized protein n=1 Tax=Solirubrobacter deserti TaxID=2282478 RepID=A0ABT4RHS8_9ACTN|nr:hypothetical protein [Solirubrobacter deserti]MDA0138086.1 hypothetical protein [Solirubrobacter deserti]
MVSSNLEYVGRSPEARGITEGKFDTVRGKDILVITGRFGFKTYDVEDPAKPKLLDEFLPPELAANGYWQNEDMELDTKRKLIIGALDPRHTEIDQSQCPAGGGVALAGCKSGFYVISYANPAEMRQIGDFVELPSGHTSSCIQGCKYIWTGGPARSTPPARLPSGEIRPRVVNPEQAWLGPILGPLDPTPWNYTRDVGDGRPIWVTDLTNPYRPEVSDQPVDIWRNDGYTDYSHDVDEDDEGIAWVSGRGGIRGYATSGYHRDPYTNQYRRATPFEPVLVGGGGVAGTAQPVMLMHNSGRPTDGSVRAAGVKRGNVLVGTEEDFTQPCQNSGKIVLSDLTDSWGGEGAQQSRLDKPYRMKALDTFHPFIDSPETSTGPTGCSAHYFEIEGPLLGAGWYAQGTRLIDISDARDVRQVGYFRVASTTANESSNTWDIAFRSDRRKGDLVYVFDMNRGVEVLRLKKGGAYAAASMKKVTAPNLPSNAASPEPVSSLAVDGTGLVCPLFEY